MQKKEEHMGKHKALQGAIAAFASVATLGALAVPALADSASTYSPNGKSVAELAQHGGAQRIAAIGNKSAKNVVLFIGDGMGDSEITVARNYLKGVIGHFDGLDAVGQPGALDDVEAGTGQYTTFSLGSNSSDSAVGKDGKGNLNANSNPGKITAVTDSSASGSAWATGTKTYNNAVDVDVYGNPQLNLFELAKAAGKAPGNVPTARDAYLLVRVAMGYDAFAQAAGEESYQMPASTKHDSPYTILTSDKLVAPISNYYRSYTKGGKTGSLDDWQNFAGWHTQDGETYVSVVLHSPKTDEDPRPALTDTAELMDWAFATFTVTAALDTTQPITELPIVYSSQTDTVMIYPADDMQTLLPRQGGAELTEKIFNVPEHLSAPIKQGDVVGTDTVTMQGETVGTVDLLAGSSVDRNELLYTMAKVKAFFSSTYFKVVVVLCIIAAVVYAVLWVYVMLLTVRRVEQPTPKRKNKPNDWNKE